MCMYIKTENICQSINPGKITPFTYLIPMNNFTIIAVVLALASVFAVMGLGIVSMVKGGEFNKKYGNRLMRWRIILQGSALALLALAFFTAQS